MSSSRFSLNSVPSGQVCFISLIFLSFLPLSYNYIHLRICSFLFFLSLSLFPHRHTLPLSLSLTHTHTLSLGYYQDKSIWSIQGSGCHFIHIFSSLVTLLKATASIYPEWMNAPTDETQEKNEAHTAWNDHSQSACHFQTCSQILYFIWNRKQLGGWSFWHNVFYSSVSEETESCLPAFQWQENGCWDFQLGGKNEMLQSVEARSRESWRRDKNVSIHANWCPDPPPGCHCLLSGEGIKGPFTRHEDFHFFPTRPHAFSPAPLSLLLGPSDT